MAKEGHQGGQRVKHARVDRAIEPRVVRCSQSLLVVTACDAATAATAATAVTAATTIVVEESTEAGHATETPTTYDYVVPSGVWSDRHTTMMLLGGGGSVVADASSNEENKEDGTRHPTQTTGMDDRNVDKTTPPETISHRAACMVMNNTDNAFPFGYGLKSMYGNQGDHVTNKTPTFTDVLDYIFCNTKTCRIVQKTPVRITFAKATCTKQEDDSMVKTMAIPMLPCSTWPSDHLMLVADVELL